jgi:hypothetical protein
LNDSSNWRKEGQVRVGPHEEFLELCALSTAGDLTEADRHKLEEHLDICSDCREAKRQFEVVTDRAIPAIAAQLDKEDGVPDDPFWSTERAEAKFFARLRRDEPPEGDALVRDYPGSRAAIVRFSATETWRNVRTLYAAGILLAITLGLYVYDAGINHERRIAKLAPQTERTHPTELAQRLIETQRDADLARAQITDRDALIADLRRKLQLRSGELNLLRSRRDQLESDLRNKELGTQDIARERGELEEKYDTVQRQLLSLQADLDSVRQQASQAATNKAAPQEKVSDLTQLLKDRDSTIAEQGELLAHDRDIRELIGARDLYIAEVYDVARTGETQKPYGRVFYTKRKSLIFYAYDLDQSSRAKKADIFQAWGLRGSDRQQALNLGIFYEDNASSKRWILKFDDPKMLAQIDAVFVTIEPHGGSQKPSGKPLLFAYLRNDPNHP